MYSLFFHLYCIFSLFDLFILAHELPVPTMSFDLNQDILVSTKNLHRRLALDPAEAPLFEGLGTHYTFIWVGSPPQRVSVIMDTGSHHTAFPCVGCRCGKHMDPFFDPKLSKTSVQKNCGQEGRKCFFQQAYSEGSSWHAYKVIDKVFVGGEKLGDTKISPNSSINFEFGCQDSETGLFRTQNVDGIMGLSASPETLPYHLYEEKVTNTRIFALCFRHGGGIFTVGGVDMSLHHRHQSHISNSSLLPVQYARLRNKSGWFTVVLRDIRLRVSQGTEKSIGGPISQCNNGKGTIVDSGTTDTYLPSSLADSFTSTFKEITGYIYKNSPIVIPQEKLSSLPSIVFILEGIANQETIEVVVHPTSYIEKQGMNRYIPRVYLSEGSGAVLGANFMNEHNVIFDIDGGRVGFAKSDCKYSSTRSKL